MHQPGVSRRYEGAGIGKRAFPFVQHSFPPGILQVFATLFALEMQNLLGIKDNGPLPPEGTSHDLGEVVRGVKVGVACLNE